MYPDSHLDDLAGTGSVETTSSSFDFAELIEALGNATSGIISAIRTPQTGLVTFGSSGGGFGGGLDLVTIAIIGIVAYVVIKNT